MPSYPDPAARIRRWHTHLVVWAAHRVLGLVFGALILLASATGGLLVMHHELEEVVERARHVVPVSGIEPRPILAQVRAAAPFAPAGYRAFRYLPPSDPGRTAKVLFVAPDGRTRWSALVDPADARVVWHGADQGLFTPWLLALHMHLHLGGWGYVVTGCAGAGLFLLGLTGLYLYRGRLASVWRLPFRRRGGKRLLFSDLHSWLGTVSIYFSPMLGLTGLIYCVTIAPGQITPPKPLASPFDLATHVPVEPMLAFAHARFPEGTVPRVMFPARPQAPVTLLVLERGAPVWRKFSRIEFDPANGALRAVRDAREATVREKFSALLAPLHMGFYGSELVKWLYVLGGFAPAILAVTGTAIWHLRTRRGRGRNRPAASALASAPVLPTVSGS